MAKRIWGVKCSDCKKRMFSFHVHDFRGCGCPQNTTVDGGRSYLKYGWSTKRPSHIYWSKQDGEYPVVTYKDTFPY